MAFLTDRRVKLSSGGKHKIDCRRKDGFPTVNKTKRWAPASDMLNKWPAIPFSPLFSHLKQLNEKPYGVTLVTVMDLNITFFFFRLLFFFFKKIKSK